MSFCFLYNVVLENHSVQNSPWGRSIACSRSMAGDAKACFSFKIEYCAVIRYLYLKGKTGKEIHGKLADVYESSAPSYA